MINKPAVTFADIQAAAERLKDRIERTETHYSRPLSKITGADVWVKYENHHETGAFKERGALNRLLQLSDSERKRGVIAASAGNHAQAVAHHARPCFGYPNHNRDAERHAEREGRANPRARR